MPAHAMPPDDAIFTVGHSTLPSEAFVARLRSFAIEVVADVRTVPRSRHNPQFNGDTLGAALRGVGIERIHLKELGGLRHPWRDSPNTGWRSAGFRGYADYMLTTEFTAALDRLLALARARRTAVMCAEAVPWRCHRSLIADALLVRDFSVWHIMGEGRAQSHGLTPFARAQGTRLTYPPVEPVQPSLFDDSDESHGRSS